MKSKNTLFGVVLSVMLLVSTAAPAFAGVAEDDLSVTVEQGDDVIATVTNDVIVNNTSANNTTTATVAVENATVTVDAENSTYAANETFTTDENGTVVLPTPEENVTVEVTATWNGSTATTTVDLVAADGEEDAGERDPYTFGQRLSEFIHAMLHAGDVDGPLGQLVSEFARNNNPGAEHRNENAEKGEQKHEEKRNERNEHAKKGERAKENGNNGNNGKHNGHAKKNAGRGGEETTEQTGETTVQEDEETAGDTTTTMTE